MDDMDDMDNVGNKEDDRHESGAHSLDRMFSTLDTSHVEMSPLPQSAPIGHDCAADLCANSKFCMQISSRSPQNRVLASSSLSAPAVPPPPVFFLLTYLKGGYPKVRNCADV